jgi:hypothetical protein
MRGTRPSSLTEVGHSPRHRMNKKDPSERDICSEFIGPPLKRAGWDRMFPVRKKNCPPERGAPSSALTAISGEMRYRRTGSWGRLR